MGGSEPQIKIRVSPIEVLVSKKICQVTEVTVHFIPFFTLYWAFLIQFVGKVNENS